MTTTSSFIKRHSVPIYFVLAFAISWGIVLVVIGGPSGIPGTTEQFESLLGFVILAMLGGPSIAGILMTGLVSGKSGFRELLTRLRNWRVGGRWYAVALLVGPLSMGAALLVLTLISPEFLPGILAPGAAASALIPGIVGGLAVGFFEELGWTGFAVPRLRLRYRAVSTALIVGSLWGAWHLLTNLLWATDTYSGVFSLPVFLTVRGFVFIIGQLLAFRILMVWVYDRTESLLVAMLMHASLTATTLILQPAAITGDALLVYDLALASSMWIVVAAVAAANRRKLSQQPLQRRAA